MAPYKPPFVIYFTLGITVTEAQVLAVIDKAFAKVPRPAHFTDDLSDPERKDHDALLRSRTRETLRLADVENPGWNPLNCLNAQGFRYFFPALARLALSMDGEAFLVDFVPFHLCDALTDAKGRRSDKRLAALDELQRKAILEFVRFVAETKRGIMEPNGAYAEELDRAVSFWETECKAHNE